MSAVKQERIVIVRERESIIVRSIVMRIKDMGLLYHEVGEDLEEVEMVATDADIFIVYLNNISEKTIKTLVYICDLVEEKRLRLLAIGEQEQYDILLKAIPALKSQVWIDRPLKMEKFNSILDRELNELRTRASKKKILIVDDDPDYAKMVREWIKERYQVFVVTDGMQAISFLAKREVDLILLDYEMPVVDGPKILEMLNSNPDTAKIPVIFLTGLGSKEAVQRVVSLKPAGYILKSTSRKELLEYLGTKLP